MSLEDRVLIEKLQNLSTLFCECAKPTESISTALKMISKVNLELFRLHQILILESKIVLSKFREEKG